MQIDVRQLQAQVEERLGLRLGRVQLHRLNEIRVERECEQRLGQLAEKELHQRGQVKYGELSEVVNALLDLFL